LQLGLPDYFSGGRIKGENVVRRSRENGDGSDAVRSLYAGNDQWFPERLHPRRFALNSCFPEQLQLACVFRGDLRLAALPAFTHPVRAAGEPLGGGLAVRRA